MSNVKNGRVAVYTITLLTDLAEFRVKKYTSISVRSVHQNTGVDRDHFWEMLSEIQSIFPKKKSLHEAAHGSDQVKRALIE